MHVVHFLVIQPLVSARSGVGTVQRGARYHWLSH